MTTNLLGRSVNVSVDPDDEDRAVIARHVIEQKRKAGKRAPSAVELAGAIADVHIEDAIRGSSTLTVSIADEDGELVDSGFFDGNSDGKLDKIDLLYPAGTDYWWSLTQVSARRSPMMELVFMERPAVLLMQHHGPVKAARGKVTRAEFLQARASEVRAGGGIDFHSKELHDKQVVEGARRSDEQRKKQKSPGISPSETKLRIAGSAPNSGQLRQVERALDVADTLDASRLATMAMVVAGIGESAFRAVRNAAGSKYWGVFQGSMDSFKMEDTEGMATSFLKGGRGFQAGGAIELANNHPELEPGEIATRVEASGEAGAFYGKWRKEAEALIEAYGGSFGGTTYHKQYNFQIGSQDNPNEDYWEGMGRLADEVNWALFLDGRDMYFDAETTLIRQKPAAVIDRREESVIDFEYTWDARHICTEMTLTLVCDPFEFRAGEVFKLDGFGAASTSSTARLPGRWLIDSYQRDRYAPHTAFKLRQPQKPKREPASEIVQRDDAQNAANAGGDVKGTPKEIIDTVVLPIALACGIRITALEIEERNASHGPTTSGNVSDHQGPPDTRWAADISNGTTTPEETKLARALAERFEITWDGAGLANATDAHYRYQLIYKTNEGGDHFNHVHFGVARR